MHGFVAYPRRELEAAWSRRSVQFLNDPRVHSSAMCRLHQRCSFRRAAALGCL